MSGGLVRAAQPTERDVVAGGVLDAVDDAVAAQAHEQVGRELRVHAHGDVVRPQLQVGVLLEDAEVILDLSLSAQCVEGSGCNHAARTADFLDSLDVLNDALSFGVDDTNQKRDAAVDDADNLTLDLLTTLRGRESNLTG